MKLTDLLDRYAAKHLRGGSSNTVRLYRHSINSFAKFLERTPTTEDLTNENVENHMWSVVSNGRSPATANKNRSQLLCLWNWAFKMGFVSFPPDVPPLKEPETVPLGWLPHELDALLRAADSDSSTISGIPGRFWFGALVRLCLDTGERVGALRQLPRSAMQDHYILVAAGYRKGKTRDRLYPINEDTFVSINRLLRSHKDSRMFPFGYCDTYLYNLYAKILDRAGLPNDRRSKFHRIRRTVASAVARAGGDTTAALDHASPKTTKKYLDTRIVGGVQVSEILASYLRDPTLRKEKRRNTG